MAGELLVPPRGLADRLYRIAITVAAGTIPALLLLLAVELLIAGWPALRHFGVPFIWSTEWDPRGQLFGAGAAIYGTLVTSALALIIATPLALGVALFISEIAPLWLRQPLAFLVDLLAAIPSVVYGLWGVFVLIPLLRESVMPFLRDTLHLGATPLFSGPAYGPSMLAAGLILAIMVLPFISAVSREVLLVVPRAQREAALALGATRWEMIRGAVLPFARSGIIGGIVLGLGRALGETMAVTMLIGNQNRVSASLIAPANTMASLIADKFRDSEGLQLSSLLAVGFVLFVITLIVNAIARWLVWQVSQRGGGRVA